MKKLSFGIGIALLLFFASCSHEQNEWIFDGDTLRVEASNLEGKTDWTGELESSLLSGKLSASSDGIAKNLTVSPTMIFASGAEEDYTPVYPLLEGFSHLNTSLLPEDALFALNTFCTAFIEGTVEDFMFAPESLFEYVLFTYDVERLKDAKIPLKRSVLGEPFISDDFLQCPVRFYRKNDSVLDIVVYMTKQNGVWKICQLHLKGGEERSYEK